MHTLGGANTPSQRRQRLSHSLNHPLHQVHHFNAERSPEGTLILLFRVLLYSHFDLYNVSIVSGKRNCLSGIQSQQEDYQVPLSKLTLVVTQEGYMIHDRHI